MRVWSASLTVAYQVTLVAAGGTAPYTWSVTAGSIPAGLTFHPEGRIDGTPTTAGSFAFTASVADAIGSHANKDFTLVVAGGLLFQLPLACHSGWPAFSARARQVGRALAPDDTMSATGEPPESG